MQRAYEAGVPSPRVLHVLQPQDELGTGFIMSRVEGETIPRKILRDERFAQVRPKLARQLGKVLADIHGLALPQLPELRRMTAAKEIGELERDYRSFDWPRPVFELALRWLRGHDPGPSEEVTLLYRLIEGLDPLNKALMLLYLDGNSYQEIAEVLGISETNVATKINRLKKTMRQDFSAPAQT